MGINYSCQECGQQFIEHNQSLHIFMKYLCEQFEYRATNHGKLTKHQKSAHTMKVKYPCENLLMFANDN